MSLDVYLTLDVPTHVPAGSGIFVRRDGQIVEIGRAEWDALYPDREPAVVLRDCDRERVYSANVTHNLNGMAGEAGLYEVLWRPETIGIACAAELIAPLRDGLARLRAEPERFGRMNPSNGWGSYDVLVRFVADYLAACERHPGAKVSVSR